MSLTKFKKLYVLLLIACVVGIGVWGISAGIAAQTPAGLGDNCATCDITKPSVLITAPSNGAAISKGSPVTITVNASDAQGIAKVEFYLGSTVLGTDTTAPYSYSWNTSGLAVGTKNLRVKAYDAAGNATTSAKVIVNVTQPTTTPKVTLGDVNGDAKVNGADYDLLVEHYEQNYAPADFNNNSVVDAADQAILLSRWTW